MRGAPARDGSVQAGKLPSERRGLLGQGGARWVLVAQDM
jgi:hypothetical protein